MINLFEVNDYKVDTSKFSNLLHDKIVREFEENFAAYVGAKYACSANSASSLICLSNVKCPSIFEIPSIIPIVVPNAIIRSTEPKASRKAPYFLVRDNVGWVGGSYTICNSKSTGMKVIDSAQKVERGQFKNEANPKDWMIFSFYPTKPVGGCDGGMIVSDDKDAIDWFRLATLNGTSPSHNNWERKICFAGWKMHINSIQADMANENLKRLDEKYEKLKRIRDIYNEALSCKNTSNHLYRIKVRNNQIFIRAMQKLGITCGIHYKAVHLNEIYSKHIFNDQAFPLSDKEQKTTASIPFHENLGGNDLESIIEKVNEFKDI
jgi:dTDP-4-amino-4,6-dideoxygalactose transaminase